MVKFASCLPKNLAKLWMNNMVIGDEPLLGTGKTMTLDLEISWPFPPVDRQLGPREVHIWAIDLDQSSAQVSAFSDTLSPDEQIRAGRFHFDRDRNHFIAGRGWLRTLLGHYLHCAAAELQ